MGHTAERQSRSAADVEWEVVRQRVWVEGGGSGMK